MDDINGCVLFFIAVYGAGLQLLDLIPVTLYGRGTKKKTLVLVLLVLRKKLEVLEENPHRQRDNMQTSHGPGEGISWMYG